MVLGVDEFRQEQTYFIEKDHSQYRLAHGYGTISGLRVGVVASPVLQVQVSPGAAINPRGQEIHVNQVMCARLNDWLTSNETALAEIFGTPPLALSLCLVLAYRECPTDTVPVPGSPCRTQQDAMAASHIAESFQLKLCLDADQLNLSPPTSPPLAQAAGLCFRPSQVEEHVIRLFGRLLRRIRITDVGPSSLDKGGFEDLVRELALGSALPVTSPDATSPLYLNASDASDFLNAMFRLWVTVVRPSLVTPDAGCNCGCDTPAEQSVLLAHLRFNVAKNWQVTGTVQIDESQRPYLLETRLIQECLLAGALGNSGGTGAASGTAVVAAGTFQIAALNKPPVPIGPTINGLSAAPGASPGTFLLTWTGFPGYANPQSGSPGTHTYVVKGAAMAGAPASAPYILQMMSFQPTGILIGVQGINSTAPAAGFCVEISEIALG
jgi:hypothetical protein